MAFPRRGVSCPSTPSSLSHHHHRRYRSRPGIIQILPGLAIILASQQAIVEAACSKISFLFPTKDPAEYNADDTLVTSYQSSVETLKIYLMCTTGGNSAQIRKLSSHDAKPFNNTFPIQLPASTIPDNSKGERCWFILHPQQEKDCLENDPTLRSPEFNVVPRTERPPQTIGLKPGPANSVSSPNASSISNSEKEGDLSVGAQIGIGVGVSIVVGLLVGGLVVFLYLRRQQRNTDDPLQQFRGWGFPKLVWHRPGRPEKPGSENPRPLLNRKDFSRTDSANFSDTTRPSAAASNSSYSPPLPQGPTPQDDSFYVGYSENLPGFYGSARGSGTKTNALGPSMYDSDARPAYQPGSYSTYHDPPKQQHIPGEGMSKNDPTRDTTIPIPTVSTTEYTVTPIEYYPPEKGIGDSAPAATFHPSAAAARPPSVREPDAELPGKESYRGYGQEFELPTQQRPQMYMPGASAAAGVAGPGPGAAAAMAARREAQEQKFLLEDVELMGLKKKKELRPPEERNPDEYL